MRRQVDFHLLGNAFEAYDAEWSQLNPPGFKYGSGGKHMRTDSSSSQLSSAPPSGEFLNRYSTSSVAEDKAEIWACLMCYQQVLKSPALRAKAQLLKKRARGLCESMNDKWWAAVVESQQKLTDHWEVHYADSHRGKAYWCNCERCAPALRVTLSRAACGALRACAFVEAMRPP